MVAREFHLPEPVRLRARALGEDGLRWMAGLAECVARLEEVWAVRAGAVLSGGSESLVLEASCTDGAPAIIKIGLPGSADLSTEARVFRLADGRGYAILIAHDDAGNAILLERLGAPLAHLGLPVRTQIEVICRTLQDAWVPLDSSCGLMSGAEKADWLTGFIIDTWQALNGPCDQRTRDRALSFSEDRKAAFAPSDAVLVHGDGHAWNALTVAPRLGAEDVRCKFVDPDGLFAERAYDLAILMRDWSDELHGGDSVRLGRQRCDLLAELTGVDPHAIWQWGFIERVSTGLMLLQIGMRAEGIGTLAVADRWRDELL